ncbi:hydroxyisourate hydrolase [Aeromonas cavernicola]|uniref:5-hydroxyisourate hydrolase n=1 Tax=Aeromonas cavernicola TaxID=1006623 RepID=A0A2H9U5D9_9GAMM|nr:hydroxyisourate hydrolase [Aeromonas cavernicola]PJG59178.1 hydroxyisourate hydrolase [Aeromonas cavernicola]
MGKLSTHVLDSSQGKPAAGVSFHLYRYVGQTFERICSHITNLDGRCDVPLLQGDDLQPGRYQLIFEMGPYFDKQNITLPEIKFLDDVVLQFNITNAADNFHVPLVVTPWSYSTYRGS